MGKICIGCNNQVPTGNLNYCSERCKDQDLKTYVYSGGMYGNHDKPL